MKSVAICGSRRFCEGVRAFAQKLEEYGIIVLQPIFYGAHNGEGWEQLSLEEKELVSRGLIYTHFQHIRIADAVFVYNPKGYIGYNTTVEIGFAVALGKPIYALAHDEDIGRRILLQRIFGSPEEFAEILRA